jgi:hypothetical protein
LWGRGHAGHCVDLQVGFERFCSFQSW